MLHAAVKRHESVTASGLSVFGLLCSLSVLPLFVSTKHCVIVHGHILLQDVSQQM